eukprot:CAMPEP_0182933136 /NCGR_PEP_ID=MMETSP0105_2-20130417/33104_1 /TAXON_ID=81532 ORGANISM="Acanthoeca-like sp., Strain 10tr" /NCGR_SAMPLE_ID=MMETSP0105_2 /ASSEMBLY_ACC=CAM_ASM_000205 /LENGTH=53 /DNA_ID=CAMNT_0025071821 /DNA_START=44 /DNA_END=201 /DNA_ORIENTATION=-
MSQNSASQPVECRRRFAFALGLAVMVAMTPSVHTQAPPTAPTTPGLPPQTAPT